MLARCLLLGAVVMLAPLVAELRAEDGTTAPAELAELVAARAAIERAAWDEAERQLMLALSAELAEAQRAEVEALLSRVRNERAGADSTVGVPTDAPQELPELVRARATLTALIAGTENENDAWQAYEDLRRTKPDDPLLVQAMERLKPAWAVAVGRDSFGVWASCQAGRMLLRLRRIGGTRATGFWIAETEASVALVAALFPGERSGAAEDQPASNLTPARITEAVAAIDALVTGATVRLPTPEEWEEAARAGVEAAWLPGFESVEDGAFDRLAPVSIGSYPPNGAGLHDVHGNVWELCRDADGGLWRRGGGWRSTYASCSLDLCLPLSGEHADPCLGFRVLLDEAL